MLERYKILVTGAAGFVGTNMVKELLKRGSKVRGVYHNHPLRITHPNLEPMQADLTKRGDCEKVMQGVDCVIMTAAFVGGAEVMLTNPMQMVTDTTVLNLHVLEAAYNAGVKKVLYISSGMVYPDVQEALTEERGLEGEPYEKYYTGGWSRRFAEVVCKMYVEHMCNKIDISVVRVNNIYGPYDSFSEKKSHVIAALIRKVVSRMEPLEVWGDGKDYKDFLYIDDLVAGCLLALEKADGYQVYNLASGENITVNEALNLILQIDGYQEAKIVYNEDKPQMIPYRVISIEKAKRCLGYVPKISLEEGLRRTIAWYRENELQL